MGNWISAVTPLERRDGDHASTAVHEHLRALIMAGVIPPGTALNQVQLAPALGVSRTPLREAIRMLQEAGIVDAEPQKLARVKRFDVQEFEAVYAERIMLEGLAARLTAPTLGAGGIRQLNDLLEQMAEATRARDHAVWQTHHRRFHSLLVDGVSASLRAAIDSGIDRGEYYRFVYQVNGARGWVAGVVEHEQIVDRYRHRDGPGAAAELAKHLARTALSIIGDRRPDHDPSVIREALAVHTASPGKPVKITARPDDDALPAVTG
jgi:DNA-binding GntR family transcriptional regulator